MFIQLTHRCDHIRLCGPRGLVAAVMDDFGTELLADGYAVELTPEEFERRLCLSVEEAAALLVGREA